MYYSYDEFRLDLQKLILKLDSYRPDAIVAVARGGLTMGHMLSLKLNNKNLFTINANSYQDNKQTTAIKISNIPNLSNVKTVLVVDEIVDSGRSLSEIMHILKNTYPNIKFKTASIFYKQNASFVPDYFVRDALAWIDFFWEVDLLEEGR